jgi:DNA-directed RNA polymerase specialized sigma24 family protein
MWMCARSTRGRATSRPDAGDGDRAEGLLRQLAPQALGAVVRRYGHFDLAEDAVQEALLAAATRWPADGVPEHPRGWLITVAARRLTDLLRAEQARRRREEEAARWVLPPAPAAEEPSAAVDDTLVLLFMCCHAALLPASQIALTLRAVAGLSTAEIARAFLAHRRAPAGADGSGWPAHPDGGAGSQPVGRRPGRGRGRPAQRGPAVGTRRSVPGAGRDRRAA